MTRPRKPVALLGPDSVPAAKDHLDDETDFQVTKKTFDKLGVPYIRPLGIPSAIPEEARTATCLVLGGLEDRLGIWFCFDRTGAYTGVLLRRGLFVPVGRKRDFH